MRILIAALALAAAMFAQPVVTNVTVSDISHASASVSWSNSAAWTDCRIQYGPTTSYGSTQTLGDNGQRYMYGTHNQRKGCQMNLYGLTAVSTYHLCPQTSTDGTNWSTCVDTLLVTLALPVTHPALPTAPATFSVAYPNTAGYTPRTVASDCSDLQTHLTAAALAQTTAGSVISIPEEAVCSDEYWLHPDTAVVNIATTSVDPITGIFTKTAHGFPNLQKVRVGAMGGETCSSTWTVGCSMPGRYNLMPGKDYWLNLIDADHFTLSLTSGGSAITYALGLVTADAGTDFFTTQYDDEGMRHLDRIVFGTTNTLPAPLVTGTVYFIVNSPAVVNTYKVSATSGGAPIDLTDAGTGTHTAYYPGNVGASISVQSWPPTSNEIIIRSAAPDTALPPEGVRMLPQWAASTASIRNTVPGESGRPRLRALSMSHNYRIGPGISFDIPDTATNENLSSTNPRTYRGLWETNISSHHILFDRVRMGTTFPGRLGTISGYWVGSEQAIINSDLYGFAWWDPGYRLPNPPGGPIGMTASVTDTTHVSWTAGSFTAGTQTATFPGTVVATVNGGSVTGTGKVWFRISDKQLVFSMPTGASVTAVTGYAGNWASQNEATPAFPLDAYGRQYGVMAFQNITLVSGAVTAAPDAVYTPGSPNAPEILSAGLGVGPYLIDNTYFDCTGICVHWDDAATYDIYANAADSYGMFMRPVVPSNIITNRSTFTQPLSRLLGHPSSNGLYYQHRNAWEVKNGSIGLFSGNIVENQWSDTGIGTGFVLQGRQGGIATDWEIRSNTFRRAVNQVMLAGVIPFASPMGTPSRRMYAHNNLILDSDGLTYIVPWKWNGGYGQASSAFYALYGGEDYLIEKNTIADGGPSAWGVFKDIGWEGFTLRNNYGLVPYKTFLQDSTPCPGLDNAALAACLLQPLFLWDGNITNGAASGFSNATTAVNTTTNPLFTNPPTGIYSLQGGSPLVAAGVGGVDVGADHIKLTRDQGWVDVGSSSWSSSTATIVGSVPEATTACQVGYGTGTDVTVWTRTARTASSGYSSVTNITGLTPATTYYWQLWCNGTVPTTTRTFTTLAGGLFGGWRGSSIRGQLR